MNIEQMAREAGLTGDYIAEKDAPAWAVLERFAALVRAQALEQCASIAECYDLGTEEGHAIAALIRQSIK